MKLHQIAMTKCLNNSLLINVTMCLCIYMHYICTIYMHYIYALYICIYMHYICTIYMHYIYALYIILIARVRVQYGKIFYEHAKYFHEPKASENVA